ncbi:hypothetical protein CHS0354_040489 [Potamilus streckersoni]|uniref:Transmembrane protein n=1 Tax=Potamilus streckersoni TaxID=2493646 RepID=A0AAE0WE01_9BIVA|nr:hypothetical protein CHS0354_040489 [Potamilus streckersoni]
MSLNNKIVKCTDKPPNSPAPEQRMILSIVQTLFPDDVVVAIVVFIALFIVVTEDDEDDILSVEIEEFIVGKDVGIVDDTDDDT